MKSVLRDYDYNTKRLERDLDLIRRSGKSQSPSEGLFSNSIADAISE